MKRIKLTIAYDGTNYVGWQIQKNGIAVEQVINEHLSKLLNEEIVVIGASRTDSGVHARGNVAVFDTETRIPPEKISYALNQGLPEDIRIVQSEEAAPDFHPRYADTVKTYQYSILNCRHNIPTYRLYTDYVYYPLNVDKMREAAQYLIGEHDFVAFSSSGGQQKTTVRHIYSIDIEAEKAYSDTIWSSTDEGRDNGKKPAKAITDFEPEIIKITVKGNGFLYNMVRIIAGTLEKVGIGVYPPEHVREILESKDRSLSAPKAAARGLSLMKIEYK